jgi:hypothetical protein
MAAKNRSQQEGSNAMACDRDRTLHVHALNLNAGQEQSRSEDSNAMSPDALRGLHVHKLNVRYFPTGRPIRALENPSFCEIFTFGNWAVVLSFSAWWMT